MTNHTVISGTGRAGTTFLVQLFTELGFNTGFNSDSLIDENSQAGLETDLRIDTSRYIVKDPHFCDYIEEIMKNKNIRIDTIIIPIRKLEDAAKSRIKVVERANSDKKPSEIIGGLFGTNNGGLQEYILAEKLYNLIYYSVTYNIPIIFVKFPDIVNLRFYLYRKLKPILYKRKITMKNFYIAFNKISKPKKITI